MDAKSKQRDCIYFEAESGVGLATVGHGQWYNMMLFMHIMQREKNLNKQEEPIKMKEENVF